jgi:membrane associated rhomboid family serine protease
MFPFRDHNPSRQTPYVTWALMAINIIVFLSYSPLLADNAALAAFFDTWAMVPAEITSGQEYHTALTSMFLHGGFMHLAGNMLFLWIFGDNVEDAMGHVGFLIFYILSGFGADLAQILSDPSSPIPMIGASGAIAGVMGAYLLLYPNAKVDVALILVVIFKVFTLPAFIVLAIWMGLQIFGQLGASTMGGGVAYWAHIGGFIAGVILTLPLWARLGGQEFWKTSHYHPPHKSTFETRTTNIPIIKRRR